MQARRVRGKFEACSSDEGVLDGNLLGKIAWRVHLGELRKGFALYQDASFTLWSPRQLEAQWRGTEVSAQSGSRLP